MQVIFIGDKYYMRSGSIMSSVYQKYPDSLLTRTDWSKINQALQNGEEVHIRPATKEELKWADEQLERVLKRLD